MIIFNINSIKRSNINNITTQMVPLPNLSEHTEHTSNVRITRSPIKTVKGVKYISKNFMNKSPGKLPYFDCIEPLV